MDRYVKTLMIPTLAVMFAVAPPAMSAEKGIKEIEKLAFAANTGAEHTEVAKQYRRKAQERNAEADALEQELRDAQKGPHNPMAVKWPAMVANQRARKQSQAMQARRAALELLTLAERHDKLASRSRESSASTSGN